MALLGELAHWLSLIVAAWAVVTARMSGGRDARLLASSGRALHMAAALMVVVLIAMIVELRAGALSATGRADWMAIAREVWGARGAQSVVWATVGALGAAVVPRLVRGVSTPDRIRAHGVAGVIAAGAALCVLAMRSGAVVAAPDAVVSAELYHPAGIAFRILYAAGIAAAVIPVALGSVVELTHRRMQWTLGALALVLLALLLGAWARYAGAAPAPELDAAGLLVEPAWTTVHVLLLMPVLLLAASAYALHARLHVAGTARSRAPMASVLLLVVAAIALSAVGPAVVDWVAGREVAFGAEVAPLRGWLAVVIAVAAGVAAAFAAFRAYQASRLDARLLRAAHATALLTAAVLIPAMSTLARQVEISPGASEVVHAGGADWRFASQGASQVTGTAYEGALVAFELESRGTRQFVTAGERLYRDAQGHPAGRIAVPGLVRGLGGDLRFTVRGLRGDEALVRVQFHPLVTPAWVMAALTIALLLAGALTLHRPEAAGSRT